MAQQPLDVARLEIQLVPGGPWVDMSAHLEWRPGADVVTIVRGRASRDEDASAATLEVELSNAPNPDTGVPPLTPDNPLGPYYPNLKRDRMIRWTVGRGGTEWRRFLGWIDTIEPDEDDGDPDRATVKITASDVLSRYARRTLLTDYGECVRVFAPGAWDYWPMDDEDKSETVRNTNPVGYEGEIVASKRSLGLGTVGLSGPPDRGGPLIDGYATFSRDDAGGSSPVILCRLQPDQVTRVSLWVRVDEVPTAFDDAVCGWTRGGDLLWRFGPELIGGVIQWRVLDASGTPALTYDTRSAADSAWRWFSLLFYDSGGTPAVAIAVRDRYHDDDVLPGAFWPLAGHDPRVTRWLTLGGHMSPRTRGNNLNTVRADIGGVSVHYGPFGTSPSYLAAPSFRTTGGERSGHLLYYADEYDALTAGSVGAGATDETRVAITSTAGRSLLDVWAELARTVGGLLTSRPDGRREHRRGEDARPRTPALTLDAEADIDAPAGGWQWRSAERPTRVTATSPAGSYTLIDAETEAATGIRLDAPDIATCAGSRQVARQVAAEVLAGSGRARLEAFGVELLTAQNDIMAAVMALLPGHRVRIAGLPGARYGATHVDVYALGWTERYGIDRALFVLDSEPADDPPEAVTDDVVYGRVAIGAATLAIGTATGTSTGTVTLSGDAALTTDPADYPLDLDWHGERVTIGAAPASGILPQPLTITARGVAPTVARPHSNGEPVELWFAARGAR